MNYNTLHPKENSSTELNSTVTTPSPQAITPIAVHSGPCTTVSRSHNNKLIAHSIHRDTEDETSSTLCKSIVSLQYPESTYTVFTLDTVFLARNLCSSVLCWDHASSRLYILLLVRTARRDYCDVWNSYCSFGMEAYNFRACIISCDGKYCVEQLVLCALSWESSCHHTHRPSTKTIVCIVEAFGKVVVLPCQNFCSCRTVKGTLS